MKFGGTSVKDAEAIGQLCRIVAREARPTLLVVSALAGVTDDLIDLAATAGRGNRQALPPLIETLRRRHLDLATEIIPVPEREALIDAIDDTVRELEALVHAVSVLHELSPRSADAIAASGEALSARLVAGALTATGSHAAWVDATQILVTDDAHARAQPLMDATTRRLRAIVAPLLEADQVPIIGGYVGATEDGVTTTLGRRGSDYSAAIFGAALDAAEIQIWTDVDGMLTADPRIVDGARLVRRLSCGGSRSPKPRSSRTSALRYCTLRRSNRPSREISRCGS